MERPYILHMFTPARQASPFDVNMAADAGYDLVVPYCDMKVDDVRNLTQDAIFSRGPKGARRTGIFIGGRDPVMAADMGEQARKAMFPPFQVSVLVDPSGGFTTAAALVATVERHLRSRRLDLAGRSILILGGTGPVGRIAGVIAAREGARVRLGSRRGLAQARGVGEETNRRFDARVEVAATDTPEALRAALRDTDVVLATAAAGVRVLTAEDRKHASGLLVAADINAVAPEGIEGVGAMDDGKALADSDAVGIGALAIGNLKYQVEHRLLEQMRTAEKPVFLGFAEAFAAAQAIAGETKEG